MYFTERKIDKKEKCACFLGFELAIVESRFADEPCCFVGHFKQFFVKIANQKFTSFGIFVFRETTKFLFTLQARQFAYTLLQKVLKVHFQV